MHPVHICSRRAKIGNVAMKFRHFDKLAYLRENGFLRARLDEFALMGGYRAEIASSEAASVRYDRVLDHVVGRDALVFVAGMRPLGKRQVPERVHFLGGCRRIWRIDLHIAVLEGLYDCLGMHHVGMSLDLVEILRKSLLVSAAFFK